MDKVEFNNVEHVLLLAEGYKYVEMVATGVEVKTSEDFYRKEIVLIAHRDKPEKSEHYILDINDNEVTEMAQGTDTDIFYLQRN